MNIIPSIDIIEGKCVRLMQGDYSRISTYGVAPDEMAKQFSDDGATVLHVVDLEGAKNGKMTQLKSIEAIVQAFKGTVQVGGGIRHEHDMDRLFSIGVSRAVIGTHAFLASESDWAIRLGVDKLVLALDFRLMHDKPTLAVSGWTKTSVQTVWSMLDHWKTIQHVLCTDISRDGMQKGPNTAFYSEFVRRYPKVSLQASGGVSSIEDIKKLSAIGVKGAIIGKAIYENKMSLSEAIQCSR